MKAIVKALYIILKFLVVKVIYPIVKWTAKVTAKIAIYAMIQLLILVKNVVIFAFDLLLIQTLKIALQRL